MNKKIAFLPLGVFCCSILSSCGGSKTLTIWVDSQIVDITKKEVDEFKAANPDFKYNVRVDTVSEQNAATNMITDVESGADLFVYAQDQFIRLIKAGALSKVPTSEDSTKNLEKQILDSNIDDAKNIILYQGEGDTEKHLYSYPVSADNGYFLYYNKDYVDLDSETSHETVEGILKACEKATAATGKTKFFGVSVDNGWWYSSGFFLSRKETSPGSGVFSGEPMCHSDWTASPNGKFIAKDDNFAKNGVFACKAMNKIFKSKYYIDSHEASQLNDDNGLIAVISGNWDYTKATEACSNLGVAKLPTFTVVDDDDNPEHTTTYQMGSFKGCKLMGVKPHKDENEAYWCAMLANHLTNKQSQKDRFDALKWGPSIKELRDLPEIKSHKSIQALEDQSKYAVVQGCYPDEWWTSGWDRVSGQIKGNTNEMKTAECQELLDDYDKQISTLVEPE